MSISFELRCENNDKKTKKYIRKEDHENNIFSNSNFRIFIVCVLILFVLPVSLSCKKSDKAIEETEVIFGPTFETGEIIVNLADLGQARYAKIQTVLELSNEETSDEINTRSPQIRDIVIEIFSSKQAEELLDLKIRDDIKKEIFDRINSVLKKGTVNNVYFTTMVIQ
ncbi:MAG: flagellar basal body-associated FliL family protein [Actinomycetota bacterium]|nr:flagellar basal body-associated FliL family protein [Actinomycetota bacterium]